MRAAILVCLFVGTACDSVFSVDHVTGPDAASAICLQDGFGGPLDTTKWARAGENKGLLIYTEDGLLRIDVPEETSASQNLFGGAHTGSRNMVGAAIEIEVAQVSDAAWPSSTGLILVNGSNQYRFVVARGQLYAAKILAMMTTDLNKVPFDPVGARFLRLRHDTSTNELVFETRATGSDYVLFERAPVEIDLSNIDNWLYAESFNSSAPAFSGRFDSVLMTGPDCH